MEKIICLLLIAVNCFGQQDSIQNYKDEINLELLGSGIIYSLNYERTFFQKKNIDFKVSFGGHFNPIEVKFLIDDRTFGLNVEPKINCFINRSSIEFGLGYTYIRVLDESSARYLGLLIPRLGYRWFNPEKSNYWGISLTPILILENKVDGRSLDSAFSLPYAGVRYGWRF